MDKKVRITSIIWSSYVPMMMNAAAECDCADLNIFSHKEIVADENLLEDFKQAAQKADVIFFYRTNDPFWDEVDDFLKTVSDKIIVSTSFDPAMWGMKATVELPVCAAAYAYLSEGGLANYRRLLEFLAAQVDSSIPVQEPEPMPWQGVMRLPHGEVFESAQSFINEYSLKDRPTVGLLFSRHDFVNQSMQLEEAFVEALEKKGLNVLPVFSHGTSDAETGSLGALGAARKYFLYENGKPCIHALINMQFFFLGREAKKDTSDTTTAGQTVEFFSQMNVPVFKPVVSYSKSVSEWEEDAQGLTTEVTFSIAMPEFEGSIEPIIMACSEKHEDEKTGTVYELRDIIEERLEHVVERILRWVELSQKPAPERKVVFVFHKNECAGLEAGVGGAAGLDSGESVVRLMRRLQDEGYRLDDIPESGEALMQKILDRKAIAEFRWTTVEEIISKKGHLTLLENEIYEKWFSEIPEKARERLVESWGEPPGREMNGVPPSMVYDGKLVITGLDFGNALVMMQPKRGCAGPRCDGTVCKILHDPDIPPPHQYIATYLWMDRVYGADVVIHVGTHGNIEFLPGKGAGLSAACWSDISIGDLPHLYIYNSDNPAEGVIAKRRSYATLVDHMQTVISTSGTYDDLKDLEDLLNDHERAKHTDPARAHHIEHQVQELIDKCNFRDEINEAKTETFDDVATRCHELLSEVRNSQMRYGMHVFGDRPEGDDRAEYVNSILRFDSNDPLSTRRLVFDMWGEDIFRALEEPGARGDCGKTYGELLFDADEKAIEIITAILDGGAGDTVFEQGFQRAPANGESERFASFTALVKDIGHRLEDSIETEALLNGMNGGYIPAGPSGLITRGRYDILPTGRNFYNVDPTRIPTKAAHQVGIRLADALLKRYQDDEGRFPETVGLVWLASDIMRADGEQIAQMLHLLGLRPRWKANGQVDEFDVIPIEELGRPRIDLNIRVSGIARDCFPDSIMYVDRAIQAAAALDEPPDQNYVRKHIVNQAAERGLPLDDMDNLRRLSYRIFCAKPGAYRAGVNLAVYASAWKTEKDLADVYVFWNGYAYGGENDYGVEAYQELVDNLRRVEVTFDKHISDESDFLNCCGFYSNYGGMTVAAKTISGKEPKTYYGDTRDPARIRVTDFTEEMRRVVRSKLLNPKFIEGMKKHGYKGAGDLNKRIGRVYGFGATTGKVDNWIFDKVAETFVLDEEMKKWFEEVNPWALEEIGRRLLEAAGRGIWKPDPEMLEQLKDAYLEIESWMEDRIGDVTGEYQGGSVDVMTAEDVESWKGKMDSILGKLNL